jgi:hypothetical protein
MSGSTDNEPRKAQVFPDHCLGVLWSRDGRKSNLWTRAVNHVICVVIDEQRGAIFNHSSLPTADDSNNPTAYRALAEQSMVQVTYEWEENEDAGPTLKEKFVDPRLFVFLPQRETWRVKEHNAALEWLEEEIPKLIVPGEKSNDPKSEVITYHSTASHLIEVLHEGTNILPKVMLNGVQQTPPVPGWG